MEVKPCPFCGSTQLEFLKTSGGHDVSWHCIRCRQCGAKGGAFYSAYMSVENGVEKAEELACKSWNRRDGE